MAATVQGLNLTKVYNLGDQQVYALNDVSLEVYPGEMVAILGRPGSGKSTLLHTLGCLQRPDSGQVSIEGRDVTQLDDQELAQVRSNKVGFVYQAFNLLPDETAVANVEVPLQDRGLTPKDITRKAEDALKAVGLEYRMSRTPSQPSPRQRQCVAIARAIVQDPPVIFADEPARALDSSSREEVMGLLQKLNEEGRTLVVATTDSGVANYCRRVVRMAEGKNVDDTLVSRRRIIHPARIPGPPTETYEREEELVCLRCNNGNPQDQEVCQRCAFPLVLTEEERQSIKVRMATAERHSLGVESASDEGEVPGQGMIEELREVPFFSGLGSKSLAKIIAALEQQHFLTGSKIVKQGDEGDSYYLVKSGDVEVVVERAGKPDIPVARLHAYEGFGEMALLADQPRSATVVAATDVEVWCLPKAAFTELLSEHLSLAVYFNRLLSQRIKALQEAADLSV